MTFMLMYLSNVYNAIPIVQIKFLKHLNWDNQSTKIIIDRPPCMSLSCIFKFKIPCESLKEVSASFFFFLSVHTYPIISFEEC